MMTKKLRFIVSLCLVLALAVPALSGCAATGATRPGVRIAVPYMRGIRQLSTNYYKQWLEERSGLDIELVEINQDDAEAYLRMAFASGNNTLDAVFLPRDGEEWISAAALDAFGAAGWLLPLEDYIDTAGENTKALLAGVEAYDLRRALTAGDGHIYALPGIQRTAQPKSAQTFWINVGWLKTLGLQVPRTTAELETVLRAFAEEDPNGNGLADELPIAGCEGDDALQATGFLMGSFAYNDPLNAHMAVEDGRVYYAPATPGWRQGLGWMAGLYAQGLLPRLNFTFTPQQVVQLANDPRDLVGCFAAGSITDVLLQDSPEVISRFIHMAPLASENGPGLAAVETPRPRPGGVITADCKAPQEVFALMDLMLGEEASRIATYGEEGVDWEPASPGQISVYGGPATVRVVNTLTGKVQNKTLAGLGPSALAAQDADGVTWNGFEVDQEYVDARAFTSYRNHHPPQYLPFLLYPLEQEEALRSVQAGVDAYTDEMMAAFITGEADVTDDDTWQLYLDELDALGLPRLVAAAQANYNEQAPEG